MKMRNKRGEHHKRKDNEREIEGRQEETSDTLREFKERQRK